MGLKGGRFAATRDNKWNGRAELRKIQTEAKPVLPEVAGSMEPVCVCKDPTVKVIR
jgi:hypothetical protein